MPDQWSSRWPATRISYVVAAVVMAASTGTRGCSGTARAGGG